MRELEGAKTISDNETLSDEMRVIHLHIFRFVSVARQCSQKDWSREKMRGRCRCKANFGPEARQSRSALFVGCLSNVCFQRDSSADAVLTQTEVLVVFADVRQKRQAAWQREHAATPRIACASATMANAQTRQDSKHFHRTSFSQIQLGKISHPRSSMRLKNGSA